MTLKFPRGRKHVKIEEGWFVQEKAVRPWFSTSGPSQHRLWSLQNAITALAGSSQWSEHWPMN